MRGIRDTCQELVGRLKAAGFTGSSIDPTEVNPPAAVWVQPRGIRDLTLAGGGTLEVWLYLIGPNTDTEHVMGLLDDGLQALLADDLDLALSSDDPIDLAAAVLLPGNTNALPAYRLAVDLDLGDQQ